MSVTGELHSLSSCLLTQTSARVSSALTDPLISGIAKGSTAYKLVGSYVTTPLNWHVILRLGAFVVLTLDSSRAVITGKETKYNSIADLKGTTIGISRYGR